MITVGEHLKRILTFTETHLPTTEMPLSEARGRCLTRPVTAAIPVPPWTNSAMDGYAVRSEDIEGATSDRPVSLQVVADIAAGSNLEPVIGRMEAARIMTGAPVPSTADTIVPQELTDGGTRTVEIRQPQSLGHNIRNAGEDRQVGDEICPAGVELTPEMLAAVASAGLGFVEVSARPRVLVLTTGDELVSPGKQLSRGQIPDSNSLLVAFLAEEAGCEVTVAHAGDGPGELGEVLERHRVEVDVIVMTGGVSVGAHDPVKTLFEGKGEVRFDQVLMQPGKPQAFGRLGKDGPLVFGLPGNPVSAWVSFQMFVRPALRSLQGYRRLTPPRMPAIAAEDWKTPRGQTQVIPVKLEDGWARQVLPAAGRGSGSHLAASLAGADGYAVVGDDVEGVASGDEVQSVRLRDPEHYDVERRRIQ